MKTTALSDVAPCSLIGSDRRFTELIAAVIREVF
jgi:hypothetical protein